MTRPNLILFMSDQQRFDQVGYASEGHFETPHLDGLASTGIIFDNAYSASTICVPARSALLTGLHPHRIPTQVNRFAMREGFWTVARELRAAGYETVLIGKMHFAPVHAAHGFETMRLCEHLHAQGLAPAEAGEARDDLDEYHGWLLANGYDDWRFRDGELRAHPPGGTFPHAAAIHPTGWIEREVRSFLERRTGDRPYFLVVSFPNPHEPHNPPEPYATMYDPDSSRLPATGFEVNAALPPPFRDAMTTFGGKPTPRVDSDDPRRLLEFLAAVRALVKQLDDSLGRIVELVDFDDTVAFFTSDHGDYGGNRGLLRKFPWIPYDDLARVPLVVTGSGVDGGRRVGDLVQSCDFALTCLDLAGVEPPSGVEFDTRSLRPLLTGAADAHDPDRAVFCGTNLGWPMIRRGRYKCILQKAARVPVLFDLERDPVESVDLADEPAGREIVTALRAALDEELSLGIPDLPQNL